MGCDPEQDPPESVWRQMWRLIRDFLGYLREVSFYPRVPCDGSSVGFRSHDWSAVEEFKREARILPDEGRSLAPSPYHVYADDFPEAALVPMTEREAEADT